MVSKRREDGKKRQRERRKDPPLPWPGELERRDGVSGGRENRGGRHGSSEKIGTGGSDPGTERRDRFPGKGRRKWIETSTVHEMSPMPTRLTEGVQLCDLIELGPGREENDMGIYVNGVLAGAITHNDQWHVWRILEPGDIGCPSELRMYMERFHHLACFPSLKAARNFVMGPFRRSVLAELEVMKIIQATPEG